MIVKTNVAGFVKDEKTNTVHNTNIHEFVRAKVARERYKDMQLLKKDVEMLKIKINKILEKLDLNE